jgi:hypothetical protein
MLICQRGFKRNDRRSNYQRESSESPKLNAFWRVAPSVRLSVLAILLAGVFFFARARQSPFDESLQRVHPAKFPASLSLHRRRRHRPFEEANVFNGDSDPIVTLVG